MIRLQLFVEGERHPVKAWRSDTGRAWDLASEVAGYIIEKELNQNLEVKIDQATKSQSYGTRIPTEAIEANAGKRNGPLLWAIKTAIETLEGAPDLVQQRINQGKY